MKKFISLVLVLVLALALVAFAACNGSNDPEQPQGGDSEGGLKGPDETIDFALANKDGKVWVTSLGQTAMSTAESLLKAAGVTYTANNLLEASSVNSGDVVVVVLGASNKGLGNAGTNQAGEIARATAFATKAGIDIVAVHTGQKSSGRGTLADPIIEAIAAECEAILVVDKDNGTGGNYDGLFTGYAENNNVPVYIYTATTKMTNSLKALFGK